MNFTNNTNTNNNRETINVNTKALTLKNTEGRIPSALEIGFWNNLLSLKIYPPLDKDKITESNFFNWDINLNTALTMEKISILVRFIENDIYAAIEAGENTFKGVKVGDNNLVGIGVTTEGGDPIAYLAIFKDLSEDNVPGSGIRYEFKNSEVVISYDPNAGKKETKLYSGELALFHDMLKASIVGLSNATVHADRVVNRAYKEKTTAAIDAIAVKVGASAPTRSNNNSYNRGGNNINMYNSSAPSTNRNVPANDAPVSQLANIDEIEQFV